MPGSLHSRAANAEIYDGSGKRSCCSALSKAYGKASAGCQHATRRDAPCVPHTGRPLNVYAGKEIARALAKGSTDPADCDSCQLDGLGPEELSQLKQQEARYEGMYDLVGQVSMLWGGCEQSAKVVGRGRYFSSASTCVRGIWPVFPTSVFARVSKRLRWFRHAAFSGVQVKA